MRTRCEPRAAVRVRRLRLLALVLWLPLAAASAAGSDASDAGAGAAAPGAPGEGAPPDFAEVRRRLLAAAGPWSEAHAKVWTEPSPVPDGAAYRVRFEAHCDCAALLFSIEGSRDAISLLYPNPYEPERRLVPGEIRELPSSDRYALRAVGGAGMDLLKLFVTPDRFAFPTPVLAAWEATPEEPGDVAALARFLATLGDLRWAAATVALEIAP